MHEMTLSLIPALLLAVLGLLVCLLTAVYAYQRLAKEWSYRLLFREFKRKLLMTFGLGVTFLVLYLSALSLARSLEPFFTQLIAAKKELIYWIYLALALFVFFSLSIYLVRMLIKYLFWQYGKD